MRSRQATVPDHHRQTEELWCCEANDPAWRHPRYATICEQSRRAFASANSDERATNAPIQISAPDSTISISAWGHHESLSCGSPSFEFVESSAAAISIILDLASRNGSLTILNSHFQLTQTRSEWLKLTIPLIVMFCLLLCMRLQPATQKGFHAKPAPRLHTNNRGPRNDQIETRL